MCYDIKTNLEAQLSRANRKGDLQAIEEIKVFNPQIAPFPLEAIQEKDSLLVQQV